MSRMESRANASIAAAAMVWSLAGAVGLGLLGPGLVAWFGGQLGAADAWGVVDGLVWAFHRWTDAVPFGRQLAAMRVDHAEETFIWAMVGSVLPLAWLARRAFTRNRSRMVRFQSDLGIVIDLLRGHERVAESDTQRLARRYLEGRGSRS
ncbi:MAG: hypothetical protein H6742_06415 [Alphaproteobacteria bacterium]|nr:hypothetical protein [Alphaproteobacteria bacterium]